MSLAPMTASEAVASLEAAVLEFKKRDINTLEVRAALLLGALHPASVVRPV